MKCTKIFVFVLTGFVVQCTGMSLNELEEFENFLQETSKLDETLKSKLQTFKKCTLILYKYIVRIQFVSYVYN